MGEPESKPYYGGVLGGYGYGGYGHYLGKRSAEADSYYGGVLLGGYGYGGYGHYLGKRSAEADSYYGGVLVDTVMVDTVDTSSENRCNLFFIFLSFLLCSI